MLELLWVWAENNMGRVSSIQLPSTKRVSKIILKKYRSHAVIAELIRRDDQIF